MTEWQPIETAPKGDPGPEIICLRDGKEEALHWVVLREENGRPAGGWWHNGERVIKDREPQPVSWREK